MAIPIYVSFTGARSTQRSPFSSVSPLVLVGTRVSPSANAAEKSERIIRKVIRIAKNCLLFLQTLLLSSDVALIIDPLIIMQYFFARKRVFLKK